MEGVGKTAFLLNLCLQKMEQGHSALFLRFVDQDYSTEIEQILIQSLAFGEWVKRLSHENRELTVVVEDFGEFLQDGKNYERGNFLISRLWRASQRVRVIFPCRHSNIADLLTMYPGLHHVRHVVYRLHAPSDAVLTKWITEEGFQTEQVKAMQGNGKMDQNSPEDVRRYCEVVGTFGPISEGLQKGMSVREITQSAFMSEIERINDLLTALLCTPEDKDEHLMYQLQNPKAMKASLKAILELLCDEQ